MQQSNDVLGLYAALFSGVYSIFWIVVAILSIIAMWKIFEKAGEEGWKALIPFYNYYVLFDIAWGNGLVFLLMFVPCVNFVVMILNYLKLAKAFGKDVGFGIGLIFLAPIFMMILGFGDARYIGPNGEPR